MIDLNKIDFEKGNGLLPCIVQDVESNRVLMLGYLNETSLLKSMEEKKLCFYSRSKKRLWTKGETSGNYLHIESLDLDCDGDTLLAKVKPSGPVCHLGNESCFIDNCDTWSLNKLEYIISDRLTSKRKDSYVSSLSESGIKQIAQKVGEEATELLLESASGTSIDFLNEAADLLFHYLILLQARDLKLQNVIKILELRHNAKSKS